MIVRRTVTIEPDRGEVVLPGAAAGSWARIRVIRGAFAGHGSDARIVVGIASMLTLLLLRHARALPQEHGDDAARALTADGRADATALGRFLADQGYRPDCALVSPSVRTRQTLAAIEKGSGWTVPATFDPLLYSGTATQVRAALADMRNETAKILVVGHNPAVAELALSAAVTGDLRDMEAMRTRFPPCSLAVLTFDRPGWQDIGGGTLESFVTPEVLLARSQTGRRAS